MAERGLAGGIWALLELIEEHRSAVAYDWRSRFGLGSEVIGDGMGWREAVDLADTLRRDPTSWLGAALSGWKYPMSHEAVLLADLFDLEHTVNSKRPPKPHPIRPWETSGRTSQRMGDTGGRSREQVEAILRRARGGAN